jgi:hypothetical protein
VASRFRVRDLGGPVKQCHKNREFPIGNFPITIGVWGPSVSTKDRCHRRIGPSGFGGWRFNLLTSRVAIS